MNTHIIITEDQLDSDNNYVGRCRCIPLDPASVEAIRKRAYRAIVELPTGVAYSAQHEADAVLAALGIKRKARK